MAENKWVKKEYPVSELNSLMNEYNYSRPIALSLLARGVDTSTVENYFCSTLKNLSSPYRLPDTENAVKRIWKAIKSDEHILIHGDFDVDGITGSAMLLWVLKENGANASVFIPQRLDSGYGFTADSLDSALLTYKCNLLLTVDCGITSIEAVDRANELGIDVIITDHHEQGTSLPKAKYIINPKIHTDLKDLQCLAGVGVAFKLAHAIINYGHEHGLLYKKIDLTEILDLVCLGTVADIVPLLGENRILTRYGLKVLSKQLRPGVRALCEIVGLTSKMKSSDIAFKLAPLINAAGRLGDPKTAFQLLTTTSMVEAMSLAKKLKEYNIQRRTQEYEIVSEAQMQIKATLDTDLISSILVYGEGWHQGVIGNVASRIAREYNRPSIVLTIIDGQAYGSGRSCANINLVEVLTESAELLSRFGGHPMAVGLSLSAEFIKDLGKKFEHTVSQKVTSEELIPQFEYEGEVFISELDDVFFQELESLEPFGHGNPHPVYKLTSLTVPYSTTAGKSHLKGYLRDRNYNSISFIYFNACEIALPEQPWDILAIPQTNFYNGAKIPQLKIVDIKPSL